MTHYSQALPAILIFILFFRKNRKVKQEKQKKSYANSLDRGVVYEQMPEEFEENQYQEGQTGFVLS